MSPRTEPVVTWGSFPDAGEPEVRSPDPPPHPANTAIATTAAAEELGRRGWEVGQRLEDAQGYGYLPVKDRWDLQLAAGPRLKGLDFAGVTFYAWSMICELTTATPAP
ncbi:hypothetical protein RKD23_005282 [Streptomyces sp. SAI-170]|uniref:hypothetical protein n=1 Tax=Streptomyces sp. SAI-170 TaxID=3377729 RepID=UPI003C7BEB0D